MGFTGFGTGFTVGGGGGGPSSMIGTSSSSSSTSKYLSCLCGRARGLVVDYHRIYLKMRNAYHEN